MKLSNPFKKAVKKEVKSAVQQLDKKQLEKVIGGATETTKGGEQKLDNILNLIR